MKQEAGKGLSALENVKAEERAKTGSSWKYRGIRRVLYEFKYNLRKKVVFRKFYVRKCTEKSYSIFAESVLY